MVVWSGGVSGSGPPGSPQAPLPLSLWGLGVLGAGAREGATPVEHTALTLSTLTVQGLG